MDASCSPERVGQECLLDLGGQGVAAAVDAVQFGGQLRDHPAGGGFGWDGEVLGGQGRGDGGGDFGRDPASVL